MEKKSMQVLVEYVVTWGAYPEPEAAEDARREIVRQALSKAEREVPVLGESGHLREGVHG